MEPASCTEATGHSALYELAEHMLVNQYTQPHYLHSNLRMPLTKVVDLLEILEQIGIVGPLTPGHHRQILFTYFHRTQALAHVEAYEAERRHIERDGPDMNTTNLTDRKLFTQDRPGT